MCACLRSHVRRRDIFVSIFIKTYKRKKEKAWGAMSIGGMKFEKREKP